MSELDVNLVGAASVSASVSIGLSPVRLRMDPPPSSVLLCIVGQPSTIRSLAAFVTIPSHGNVLVLSTARLLATELMLPLLSLRSNWQLPQGCETGETALWLQHLQLYTRRLHFFIATSAYHPTCATSLSSKIIDQRRRSSHSTPPSLAS